MQVQECLHPAKFASPASQLEVRELIRKSLLDFFSLLETKIKPHHNSQTIKDFFGSDWKYINNETENSPASISIWVFWKKRLWTLKHHLTHAQYIHLHLANSGGLELQSTFVYAKNNGGEKVIMGRPTPTVQPYLECPMDSSWGL